MKPPRLLRKIGRWAARGLLPNERLRWTREGLGYIAVWLGRRGPGLHQQRTLILLTAGRAGGPIAASIFVSGAMVRRLRVPRRAPAYTFAGSAMPVDYILENDRRRV